jgi:hypothetical protein
MAMVKGNKAKSEAVVGGFAELFAVQARTGCFDSASSRFANGNFAHDDKAC